MLQTNLNSVWSQEGSPRWSVAEPWVKDPNSLFSLPLRASAGEGVGVYDKFVGYFLKCRSVPLEANGAS